VKQSHRAARACISIALILAFAPAAIADEAAAPSQIIVIPVECMEFWRIPGGSSSPVAWDALLSFAACIQDTTINHVDRADQLEALVEQLQAGLEPSLQFYGAALSEGPGPTKLRAAYFAALGQIALITRARASISSPALRERLDALLEPHAKLAYTMFTSIGRTVADDPRLAPDAVSRYMVRSSRNLADSLCNSWPVEVTTTE
jgi:hypothetical protein